MAAILQTRAALHIVQHDEASAWVALQISRNLYQYFAADTEVVDSAQAATGSAGNVISIGTGDSVRQGALASHAIRICNGSLTIRDRSGIVRKYSSTQEKGVAAIFLRPLSDERLELVVWGSDVGALQLAARLVPTLSGVGTPDFVVLDSSSAWRGLEGVLAMGFLDSMWGVGETAFL